MNMKAHFCGLLLAGPLGTVQDPKHSLINIAVLLTIGLNWWKIFYILTEIYPSSLTSGNETFASLSNTI